MFCLCVREFIYLIKKKNPGQPIHHPPRPLHGAVLLEIKYHTLSRNCGTISLKVSQQMSPWDWSSYYTQTGLILTFLSQKSSDYTDLIWLIYVFSPTWFLHACAGDVVQHRRQKKKKKKKEIPLVTLASMDLVQEMFNLDFFCGFFYPLFF